MGDGKVLEKMGERRRFVRRDATVGRLSAIFLEDMEGSVKPSTLACYRRNIQCHILPALGECVAAELTAAEVNDYIQQLQEDYSPKLVREIGGLLLRIVGMAGVGYGEDVTLPKVRQKAVEVFTEPELKQMGQVILRRPDRTGLGVLLTAYTGLRLGELCGLQWQDVDVGAGLLHIQRTVERIAQIGGGTCLTVQPPKTENSERWIPIPKEMLRMLKPETKQPDSYLLTGGEIVPDPRTCQYRYKALLERCDKAAEDVACAKVDPNRMLLGFGSHSVMVKGGQLNAQGFPFSLLVLDGCSVHFHGETLLQILFCDIFGGLALQPGRCCSFKPWISITLIFCKSNWRNCLKDCKNCGTMKVEREMTGLWQKTAFNPLHGGRP